jgi:hypothetical protein
MWKFVPLCAFIAMVDNNLETSSAYRKPSTPVPSLGTSTPKGTNTDIVVRAQDRAYILRRLRSVPVRRLMDSLFPRLFVLHVMLDDEEFDDLLDLDIDALYHTTTHPRHSAHTPHAGVHTPWQQPSAGTHANTQANAHPHTASSTPHGGNHSSSTAITPFTPQAPYTPYGSAHGLSSVQSFGSLHSGPTPKVPILRTVSNDSDGGMTINTADLRQHLYANMQPAPPQVVYKSPSVAQHLIFKIPRLQSCSMDVLESDGIYLLDDSIRLWLFIGKFSFIESDISESYIYCMSSGRNVPESLLIEWFGIKSGERPRCVSFNASSRNSRIMKVAVDIVMATSDVQLGNNNHNGRLNGLSLLSFV